MKTTKSFKRFFQIWLLGIFFLTNLLPVPAVTAASSTKIIYPLKEISKLECRFKEFSTLGSNCKETLPILKTKDYQKYANLDGGYNKFTRIYTVLWGASYKYGWDVGNGGHIGTDIATAKGTPIYNIADGVVIHSKTDKFLGQFVSVKHRINGKTIVSNYAHMSKTNVKKGQTIKVGTKIGEVGSTGNSTGNHLHFQVDLESPSYPYYYDRTACPYSYYQITEEGVCFNELERKSIDPLKFLETKGAILDNIKVTKVTVPSSSNSSSSSSNTIIDTNYDSSIFNRTVYIGYSKNDIAKVQQIYKNLGEYKGRVNGNYADLESSVIAYQIKTGVIKDKNEYGAGWFGPKTRAQTKSDYEKWLAERPSGTSSSHIEVAVENGNKTQKISRKNMLSREEIEAREVEDFIKRYNIELKMTEVGGNIQSGKTTTLKLSVTDKKGRAFKGDMPGAMTFLVDSNKINVFPQKLYNFTDGKRDIKLTGKKTGDTTLYIKIGQKTIKTIPLKVYSGSQSIYPSSSVLLANSKVVIGEEKTAIVVFKDQKGKNLINLKYGSSFKLNTSDGVEVCIKKGSIKDIRKIYNRSCNESEYTDQVDFTYSDTVGGLLIFDYKATGRDAKINVINKYDNKSLSSKKFTVTNPKGLKSNYVYKNEVIDMLEDGIAEGINKGYFLEDRELTEKDALSWIENTLESMQDEVLDPQVEQQIKNNLASIKYDINKASKFKKITRGDLLDMTYKYLVFDKDTQIVRDYIDTEEASERKISAVFDGKNTWKDQFGEKYFQPAKSITRGEGAYMLANLINKNRRVYLVRK